jgi:hypothetical protein
MDMLYPNIYSMHCAFDTGNLLKIRFIYPLSPFCRF